MRRLGVIGGTGLDQLQDLVIEQRHTIETPYGAPSRPLEEGRLGQARVVFLQRHGGEQPIPPHAVNYRANIWAMQSLDVTDIVAINAVGGITPHMQPGELVIPDQIIDYTWGREHTFDDGSTGSLMHVDFTEPYDRELRLALLQLARDHVIDHEDTGTYGATQGPRLETAAEIRRMVVDGCDIVGMTGMPEAALARELGLAYASICMVVNAAAGLDDRPLSLDMMREILVREAGVVGLLLRALVGERYLS